MWMVVEAPSTQSTIHLYKSFPKDLLSSYVSNPNIKLFWIDQGMGALTLLYVAKGGKSASATEVTPRILKQYLKNA